MQVQLLSDLHVDRRRERHDDEFFDGLRAGTPDLLVVAGDLVTLKERPRAQKALDELSKRWTNILWVPGNHEFYGINPIHAEDVLRQIGVPSNIEVVLEPRVVTFKTQRFVCGTMWYSKAEVQGTGCIDYKTGTWVGPRGMVEFSDFRHIRHLYPWVYQQNTAFRALVEAELGPDDVVVTHHLPSAASTPQQFQGDIGNCFFVSDQEDLIRARRPRLFLHGHTHSEMDYELVETRVRANPVGYPGERDDFVAARGLLNL